MLSCRKMPLLQTLTFGSRFNQPLDRATWVDVEGVVDWNGQRQQQGWFDARIHFLFISRY